MLKAETVSTRAPRGAKPVSQAFFTALDALPEASRATVARAAQVMIRDQLRIRRDKMKAAAVKEKARKTAAPAGERAPKQTARSKVARKPRASGAAPRHRGRKPAQHSSGE